MNDITFTTTNIVAGTGAKPNIGKAGEAFGFGDVICINKNAANKLYKASSYELTDTYRMTAVGISLGAPVAAGLPVSWIYNDTLTLGASVLEKGMLYCLSRNRGKICPFTDYRINAVTNKALTSNVATLTTAEAHPFSVGDLITVTSVDSTFNITSSAITVVGSSTTFSYAVTHANVSSTSATGSAQVKASVMNSIGWGQTDSILQFLLNASGIAR